MERFEYLILGNSTAGVAAAEAIRSVDREGKLAIVSEEPYHTYSRPLISYLITGERDVERMGYRSGDFYERIGGRVFLGVKVERIDCEGRKVVTSGGEGIGFGKLLIATGGRAIIPPIAGVEREGVFTFTSYDDARRVKDYIERGGCDEGVVVGGGLIGLQAAEALCRAGLKVTVVELLARVLAPVLDEEGSRLVEEVFRRNGVRIVTGVGAKEIRGGAVG
ncbi:MAG: FAD-dependent oxidoreductase, partial [bacterium]